MLIDYLKDLAAAVKEKRMIKTTSFTQQPGGLGMDQRAESKWCLAGKNGETHYLVPGMIFIGRQECDIVVESASVDKRHAVIFYNPSDKQFHIKDLNSLAGTYLNGIRIPEQSYVKLGHMDYVRFGYGQDVFQVKKVESPVGSCSPTKTISGFENGDLIIREGSPVASPRPSPPPRQTRRTPSPPKQCTGSCNQILDTDGRNTPLNEADSLEDLQKIDIETSKSPPKSTPIPHPTTLAWKPLPSPTKVTISPLSGVSSDSRLDSQMKNGCSPEDQKSQIHSSSVAETKQHNKESSETSPVQNSSSPESETGGKESPSAEKPSIPSQASSAMAFTIPFDSDFSASKKKFGLKDSIKKFAPSKPESEKPPLKQKPPKASTTSKKGSQLSDGKKKWSSSESRGSRDSAGGDSSVYDEAKKETCGLWDQAGEAHTREEKLSDSASYLIQRMLNSDPAAKSSQSSSATSKQSSVHSEGSPKRRNPDATSPGDDKSETGTYTVEAEQLDPDVEEARKKIDEVFGVVFEAHGAGTRMLPSLDDKMIKSQAEQPSPARSMPEDQSWNKGNISPGNASRPKRRLPTPPTERSPLEFCSADVNSSLHQPQNSQFATYPLPSPRHRLGSNSSQEVPRSPPQQRQQPKLPQKIIKPERCASPLNTTVDLPPRRHSGSESSSSNHLASRSRGTLWRKMPWNLTGSEADLDQCKSETASVLSDTSTEPSSHSSHSGHSKSDVAGGPQMRLNRAFALRRARLGIDSDSSSAPSKSGKGSKPSGPKGSGSNPNLSRQDGGRFSLRLPRSATRPVPGRTQNRNDNLMTRSEILSRTKAVKSHQRIDSDPGVASHRSKNLAMSDGEQNRERNKNTSRNCTSDGDTSPCFYRSASFCGDELDNHEPCKNRTFTKPNAPCRTDTFLKSTSSTLRNKRAEEKEKQKTAHLSPGAQPPNENGVKPEKNSNNKKELSALDSLVISAIYQLSGKLRTSTRMLIERERHRYPENSDSRLMIEEVLPQVVERKPSDSPPDGNLTRELSSILKNLKRVEQSLEVLNSLGPAECDPPKMEVREAKQVPKKVPGGFFVVDV